MAIALIIALVLGGGTSFAAEGSLPGDLLYPVKIGVNEEFRAALALGTEADARWEAERASRRLEEAEQLAMKNRLDVKAEAEVQEKFEAHADRAKEIAASVGMKKNGSAAAVKFNADFEATLRGHEKTLADIAAKGDASGAAALNLATLVKRRGDGVAMARAEAEADVRAEAETKVAMSASADTKGSAEGRREAFRNKIAEVRSFMERSSASVTVRAEAEARLVAAEKLAAEGSLKLEAGAYAEAIAAFNAAFDAAQEAKAMLTAREELKADTQADVRVDAGARAGVGSGAKTDAGVKTDVKVNLGL